ncbi:MAG: DUF484 family protein [Gammaproteobacteria bacterium]|nr:DUF484 family protein [Gammaproteobacteria bacterium]
MNASTSPLDASTIAAYLDEHPDFFAQRPELLLKLKLPHVQAGASSLLERQIALQRERHRDLQGQVIELLQTAAGNEQLFVHCRHLVLCLLDAAHFPAAELPALLERLEGELMRGFGLEAAAILLLEPGLPGRPGKTPAELSACLGPELLRGPWCGTPTSKEREALFGAGSESLQSAGSVPLGTDGGLGLLALGSADPERFRAGMGLLFLDFIGAALSAVLRRAE